MSELREYQSRMLKSKKKIVMCNWERGDGKTWSIAQDIIRGSVGNYVYCSRISGDYILSDYIELKYKTDCLVDKIVAKRDGVKIKFIDDLGTKTILFISKFEGIRNVSDIKCIYFDEIMPNEDEIETIKKYHPNARIVIMMTNDDIEYIEHKKKNSIDNFYETQIKELMDEYATIPKDSNTTMTREKVLYQMRMLKDMSGKMPTYTKSE